MFLLLSVLLAVIVEFWLSYLKKTNDSEKRKERLGITKAFIWIDKDRKLLLKKQLVKYPSDDHYRCLFMPPMIDPKFTLCTVNLERKE